MLVEVIAPVGLQSPGLASRASPQALNRGNRLQQGQKQGDVVPVAAGECDGERGPVPIDDQVVLGAGSGPVDR
ncbi:hypothetical protein SAFG77S_06331 [Streptomyces afghaniensis]